MKLRLHYAYLVFFVLFQIKLSAPTPAEKKVLDLSHKRFQWETNNELDLLEKICHKKLLVVSSSGESQT